jgi:hypothetical protein
MYGAACPSADPGVNLKYISCEAPKYDFAPLPENSQLDDEPSMLSELWDILPALVLMQNVASATEISAMKHALSAAFLIQYAPPPPFRFTKY